jgi:hypothetical protein
MRLNLEATRWEFETQLAAVEARTGRRGGKNSGTSTDTAKRGGGKNAGTGSDRVKPLKSGSMPGQYCTANSRPQLITTIGHPARRPRTCLPYCRASFRHPTQCPSRSNIQRYHRGSGRPLRKPQFKARIQLNGEPIHEYVAAVEYLAHCPSDYLRTSSRGRPSMYSLTERETEN